MSPLHAVELGVRQVMPEAVLRAEREVASGILQVHAFARRHRLAAHRVVLGIDDHGSEEREWIVDTAQETYPDLFHGDLVTRQAFAGRVGEQDLTGRCGT